MKTKIILDVDTGIDDALAITFALGRNDAELIGVTTCFGNVTLETASRNSLNLLDLLGRNDVPVYAGAKGPGDESEWQVREHLYRIHGNNGIGNVELPVSKRKVEEKKAWQFMVEACRKYKDELILICVGPLTNLAKAIELDREAVGLCKKIVIMGGALTVKGNVTPYAEANIFNDVEAAQKVIDSGLDLYFVGLDVTLQTIITGSDIMRWKQLDNEKASKLYEAASYYYSNEFEVVGGAMHDPLAVEAALDPEIITEWFPVNLMVEQEGVTKGRMIGDKDLLNIPDKTIHYGLKVNGERFVKDFEETVLNIIS